MKGNTYNKMKCMGWQLIDYSSNFEQLSTIGTSTGKNAELR